MFFRNVTIAAAVCCLASHQSHAADTLSVSIPQADSIFLKENLQLIAAQYNINYQKALVIQSKVYPNPTFTADFNAYDPNTKQYFRTGQTGQKAFALEQLILLGGKRKAQIDIAKKEADVAAYELEDLIRNLKFTLHNSLYTVKQQVNVLKKYNEQLALLDTIIQSYEIQTAKGNIAAKEVVRLKAVYLKINNERADVLESYNEEMATLRLLLNTRDVVTPKLGKRDDDKFRKVLDVESLYNTAMSNRPDVKMSALQSDVAALTLKLEKRNAIPDLALNSSYDQRGGAFNNQVNVGVAFDLPVWNRNRGNIMAARQQVNISNTNKAQLGEIVYNDVQHAVAMYNRSVAEYFKTKDFYNSDFDIVFKGLSENFQKRNISLLEFVDFLESYNESITELQRVQAQVSVAAEKINQTVSSEIF